MEYYISLYTFKARLLSDFSMNCLRTEDTLWNGAVCGKVKVT